MNKWDADIIASIRMYPTEAGGRKGPSLPDLFRCLFEFHGDRFDCALLLDGVGPVGPGASIEVPIKFLSPDLIKSRLRIGDRFFLWELRHIGEGEVKEIVGEAA